MSRTARLNSFNTLAKIIAGMSLSEKRGRKKPSVLVRRGRQVISPRRQAITKGSCGFCKACKKVDLQNSTLETALQNPGYLIRGVFPKSHCPTVCGAFNTRKNGLYFNRWPWGTRWKCQESWPWPGRPWQRCQCYHSNEGIRGWGLQGVRRPYIYHWLR